MLGGGRDMLQPLDMLNAMLFGPWKDTQSKRCINAPVAPANEIADALRNPFARALAASAAGSSSKLNLSPSLSLSCLHLALHPSFSALPATRLPFRLLFRFLCARTRA